VVPNSEDTWNIICQYATLALIPREFATFVQHFVGGLCFVRSRFKKLDTPTGRSSIAAIVQNASESNYRTSDDRESASNDYYRKHECNSHWLLLEKGLL
jgi:hypothetical protein